MRTTPDASVLTTGTYGPAVRDALLEMLLASGSDLTLLPVQDVFGWRDRINEPATRQRPQLDLQAAVARRSAARSAGSSRAAGVPAIVVRRSTDAYNQEMATLRPFRALRPTREDAPAIAAVPYDVVNADEARALANGNPLSFLRVSRAELELPPGTNPYADEVYGRAVSNFDLLKASSLVVEDEPSVYFYRLSVPGHEQTGVAGCFSLDEYDSGVIKKHERTRRDKEDDRTRHMIDLGAQTGPVFLTYRSAADVDAIARRATADEPLYDFTATDSVRHTMWRVSGSDREELVRGFSRVPSLYIADGHHRAASAARARDAFRNRGTTRPSLGDGADYNTFLGVAFPHDQVRILSYNRIVKEIGRAAVRRTRVPPGRAGAVRR